MNIELSILNKLIDKYERTNDGKTGNPPSRSIALILYGKSKTDLEYSVTNPGQKEAMHTAVQKLQSRNLIEIKWIKHAQNNIIEKLILNGDELSAIYKEVKRQPICQKTASVLSLLQEALPVLPQNDWAYLYLSDEIQTIQAKHKIPSSLDPENIDLENWLLCLKQASNLQSTITERAFSLRFSDSKTFERDFKSKLANIVRKYVDEEMKPADALEMIGIVRYPEHLTFAGPIVLEKEGKSLDIQFLADGITLSCEDFISSTLHLEKVNRVTSIENKANYLEYIRTERNENELVIYHAGQIGPRRMKCFQKIGENLENQYWRHWSDIDYGGLLMLLRLRKNLSCPVKSWRMNIESLKKYKDKTLDFDSKYQQRLEQLKQNPLLEEQHELIDYMLENKIRLEQEAFIE